MVDFEGINVRKTKIAAHTILKDYRRLRFVAKREIQQKLTVSYDSQPSSTADSTPEVEKRVVAKIYAEKEVDRIEAAIASLTSERSYVIINLCYVEGYERSDSEVCNFLDYSMSTFNRYKERGLLEIAWALGCEVY